MDGPRRADHPAISDPAERLAKWARAFVGGDGRIRSRCSRTSASASPDGRYQSREDEGTQSPTKLSTRRGSCRDFAVLFVEAARCLGFGARIVSGYLFNPDRSLSGSIDAGSTHAWGEVFVRAPAGSAFDPTNRSVGGSNLIPVAVARDIRQAMPVAGSFVGSSEFSRGRRRKST